MIGQTLGQYRILERLGEGGMGEVYRALDELLDREVALKMLRPELAHRPDVLDRFRAEAVVLARLDHANIARLHGLTRQDPHFFMVMEFVPGQTLLGRIQQGGRLTPRAAVEIMSGLLDGLEYAHQRGVVHRDVKPANVIVRPDGQVKITDFGIARVLGSERATRAGHIIGTLEYMAPEQIRGEDVDARADLYAAGIVFYELVSGQAPFTATTEYEIMRLQIEAAVPPLGQVVPGAPRWCDDVLARALAKTPADRFSSAAEFRDRLAELIANEPTTMGSARPTRVAPVGVPATRLEPVGRGFTLVHPPSSVPETEASARNEPEGSSHTRRAVASSRWTWRHAVSAAAIVVIASSGFAMARGWFTRTPAPVPGKAASELSGGGSAVPPPQRVGLSEPPPELPPPAPVPSEPPDPTPTRPRPTPVKPIPSEPGPVVRPPAAPVTPPSPSPAEPPAPDRVASPAHASVERRPAAREAMEFAQVALLIVEGSKPRERDAVLKLEPSSLVVLDKRTNAVLRTLSYSQIGTATYSQSRHPRWKTASAGVALGGVFAVPLFFMKGTKHWLSLEGSSEFIVLRLDKNNVQSIIPEIQLRTGVTVAREVEK